jgi:NAD(P)-dependent dehydrogenase (short-subunit alcohol dehydrogenase family)
MSKRLKDKVAIVTGGNSGIGRGIARKFVAEGARVAISGRDEAKGIETLRELVAAGGDVAFFPGDLSVEAEARHLVALTLDRFGRLDILINNAGVGARRCGVLPDDPPGVRLRKVLGPTLEAAYYVSAYAMPELQKAGGGSIVNISSTASQHGNWGNYGIAKAGIEAMTRAQAVEGAPHRIRANALAPGWIDTSTARSANAPQEWEKDVSLFGRMGTLEEMAQAVLFFASDESSFVTGMTLVVDGGFTIVDYPALPWLERAGAQNLFPGTLKTKV